MGILTGQAGIFWSIGFNLFKAFATILIAWTGIKTALNSSSGEGPSFSRFAELVLLISFAYAMIFYYNNSLPGMNYSFRELITQQAFSLADTLAQQTEGTQNQLDDKFQTVIKQSEQWVPDLNPATTIKQELARLVITVSIAVLELAMFAIVAFGYLAIGILTVIGPVFLPFFLVPKLDFLFWGWFKSFLQYAFYPVIAQGFVLLMAKLMLKLVDPIVQNNMADFAYAAAMVPFFVVVLGVGIMSIFKVPTLVSHIFSGSAGAGSDALQTAVRGVVMAAGAA